MPPFPRPNFDYAYTSTDELDRLKHYRETKPGRNIPNKHAARLLLASWNIANLGDPSQVRHDDDVKIIAGLLGWFDLIAIQEVKEDLTQLRQIIAEMPDSYRLLFTDVGGNYERMAMIYDSAKVELLELAGEIAVPPSAHRYIRISGIEQKFRGFDRNPYAVAFRRGDFAFTLVNAHLFFGSKSKQSSNRRALEAYALGRWADLQVQDPLAYTPDCMVIGDLNIPIAAPGDPIYEALTKRGLMVPEHTTEVGSTITGGTHYDQIAFFPDGTRDRFVKSGVFDFDGALFPQLWSDRPNDFSAFVRYHISDHRILWAQFDTHESS